MTKELLIRSIKTYARFHEWENKLEELDITILATPLGDFIESYFDLIRHMCKDEVTNIDEIPLIDYYVWELGMGNPSNELLDKLWQELVEAHPEISEDNIISTEEIIDTIEEIQNEVQE